MFQQLLTSRNYKCVAAVEVALACTLSKMTESTEVLELNVGGKIYFCSKATLTKDESSMFYKMFVTGDVSVPKDQRGRYSQLPSFRFILNAIRYFIDRKEKYFGKVYKFLRDGKLPSSLNALVSLQQVIIFCCILFFYLAAGFNVWQQ